jgi:hypothetical protein
MCGYCVRGFDHHCHFFNTCIGRRNLRSFVLFLLTCYAWLALSLLTNTVNAFFVNRGRGWQTIIAVLLILVNDYVGESFRVGEKCRAWTVRGVIFLVAVGICIFGHVPFENKLLPLPDSLILLSSLLLLQSSLFYLIGIKSMLWQYLDLIARHLTLKEKVARKRAR